MSQNDIILWGPSRGLRNQYLRELKLLVTFWIGMEDSEPQGNRYSADIQDRQAIRDR